MDYQAIGQRIKEQRKEFKHISQEQMADDLGMYKAEHFLQEKNKMDKKTPEKILYHKILKEVVNSYPFTNYFFSQFCDKKESLVSYE